jgi:hypothetical protein
VYDADSFSNWLKKFFTTGVFEGDCQVTALGSMVVNLAPGYANIMGKVKELENQTFTLEPADGSYPRIDTIVIERNDTDRDITAKVVTGQLSGNTPAPTPRVWENGVYQLIVAEVYVAAGTTEVTQADITDKRSDPDVCGIVAGTVTEMDFSQFTAQFESYFEQFKASNLEEFDEWFEMIKGQRSEDAAGHLQNEIDDINEILGDGLIASNINYDNTHSGMTATKVQGAIDELNDNLAQTPIDMGGGVVLSTLDEKINYMLNGSPIKVGVAVQEYYANLSSDRTYDISKYSNIKLCVWGRSGSNNKSTAIKIDGQTVKTISDTGGATTLEVGVTENNVLSIGPSSSGGSVLVAYMLLGFYDNNMVETINAPT